MPAFVQLADKCAHQNKANLLGEIGDADCFGGWEKILSDVAYNGISDSGKQNFDRSGSYLRIAVVRKSGYVSCNCKSNPACLKDKGMAKCHHSVENCCQNKDNVWNLCEYIPGHTAANMDAPFEMAIDGSLLVEQKQWSQAPVTGSGKCSTPEQTSGMIQCTLPFSITTAQSVVLSWNEGRRRASTSDNCGTLVVDVYACPGFKLKRLGAGYCQDYKYLPEGGCKICTPSTL
jgi:hypothetical protein